MRRAKPSKAARKRTRARRPAKPPRKATPSGQATEAALAAFAHEVRTPLTGILALSELLAASDLPERERGWAAAVKSAAEHLAQLTTLVVGGTKAATRAPALRREPLRPRALADALAATLTARAQTKGLATEVRIGAGEHVTDLGRRTVAIVGKTLDQDRDAAGPVALVGDLLVRHPFELARGPLDGAVDRVERH